MNRNSIVFYSSLAIFLCSPFFALGGFYFAYSVGHTIAWALSLLGIVITNAIRAREDVNFRKKIFAIACHPVVIIFAIFISWIAIRSLFAGGDLTELLWGGLARTDGLYFLSSWLVAVVCFGAWMHDGYFQRNEKKVLAVVGIVLFISACLFQQLGFDKFIGPIAVGRLAGSVGNPLYLAGIILFVPWFAWRVQNKFVFIFATLISAAVLYATDARGAFVGVLAGAAVYLFENKKIAKKFRYGFLSVMILCLIVGGVLFATGKIQSSRLSTITTRLILLKSGVHALAAQPLIGFGMTESQNVIDRLGNSLNVVAYGEVFDSTHSTLLDFALMGGVVAFGLLLIWVIVVYRTLAEPFERATFVAVLVLSLTTPFMFWVIVPLAYVIGSHLQPTGREIKYENICPWVLGTLGTITIILSAAIMIILPYNAKILFQAQQAVASGTSMDLPQSHLAITPELLPFSTDFAVEMLRVGMPSGTLLVVPSYAHFISNIALPAANVFLGRVAHPDQYFIAATWANMYAGSVLTSEKQRWYEQSRALQEKALTINPDRAASVFQLSDTLRELGRISDALDLLKKFAVVHPELAEAQLNYALMVDISGDTKHAYELEQQMKQIFPNHDWDPNLASWFTDIEKREAALNQVPSK